MKAMKFNIGSDPALSEKVQNILFGMGYTWQSGATHVKETNSRTLYASDNIIFIGNMSKAHIKEINIDWLRSDRETVKVGDITFYKDEFEEATKDLRTVS